MFPTGKNQQSPSAVTAKVCEISRSSVDKLLSNTSTEAKDMRALKNRGGEKPIILNTFNQSLLRKIVLNFYSVLVRFQILKKYIERPKTQMA